MTGVSSDLVKFLREQADFDDVDVAFNPSEHVHQSNPDGNRRYPSVVTVSEDFVVPGGGSSQFTAMSDGKALQDRVWLILVDCWGGPVTAKVYEGVDSHPDDVADALSNAVSDACIDASAVSPPTGYEWVSADPPQTANDEERKRTHYRRQVTCRMKTTR